MGRNEHARRPAFSLSGAGIAGCLLFQMLVVSLSEAGKVQKAGGQVSARSVTHVRSSGEGGGGDWPLGLLVGVIAAQRRDRRQGWTLSGTRILVQVPLLPLADSVTPGRTFYLSLLQFPELRSERRPLRASNEFRHGQAFSRVLGTPGSHEGLLFSLSLWQMRMRWADGEPGVGHQEWGPSLSKRCQIFLALNLVFERTKSYHSRQLGWMDTESIMPSGASQSEKDKYHVTLFIHGI